MKRQASVQAKRWRQRRGGNTRLKNHGLTTTTQSATVSRQDWLPAIWQQFYCKFDRPWKLLNTTVASISRIRPTAFCRAASICGCTAFRRSLSWRTCRSWSSISCGTTPWLTPLNRVKRVWPSRVTSTNFVKFPDTSNPSPFNNLI